MKEILTVFIVFMIINACNQEGTDLPHDEANIENDMVALSNSIKYTTRIHVATSGRLLGNVIVNLEELEEELIAYHENNGYENFESDYNDFLNNQSTIELDSHISNLLDSDAESARTLEGTNLDELLNGYLDGLDKSNISENVSQNLRVLIDKLNIATSSYQNKLQSSSEVISGEEVITSYDKEEYARIIKVETGRFEQEVVQNMELEEDEKRVIFYFTTVVIFNIDGISSFYESFEVNSEDSGRVLFWNKIKRVFRNVFSSLVTVFSSAIYILKNMAIFGWINPGFAIIAGVTGFLRGVQTSHFIGCTILRVC